MVTTNENSAAQGNPGSQAGQDHRQALKDDLSGAVENVRQQADHYKDSAANQLESLARNAESAAHRIDDKDTLGLSGYVADVAGQMTSMADNLRSKNAEQLLQDAGRLARENPLLFVAGSIVLGLGLSRLLKASVPDGAPSRSLDSLDPSYSAGHQTPPLHDPISPATLAAEEMVATHPHDGDVRHSARPGMGIPDPAGDIHRSGDLDDGLPGSGTSRSGFPRGGV
ncbi:hypothetical protein EGJ27_11685 [Pseudomonas sp. v388]|uniref:hypothetical protein n=1 Tax=Pseudomonas sp. v388 TaxID=2479849 RepID=UPI000F791B1C|nr:hypothetical protein [Pseudomonas sp. v388]RRV07340.1 hypothetical protein EGJ27_11685 [Pseudomonas sp. v388]